MAIKIFFCYAHEDEALLNKLKTHLRPLQRQGLIDVWHDRDISAGAEWEKEISAHLNTANIILLLISPDFMDSDYCYSIEMKKAIELHERREARVIPIILRHVYWQGVLGKLQALPTDAKPVLDRHWHNLDEAFFNVVEGVRNAIEVMSIQLFANDKSFEKSDSSTDTFTEYARNILDLAQREAQRARIFYIATEHILLGIIREKGCTGAQVLSALGANSKVVRDNIALFTQDETFDTVISDEIGLTPNAKKVIELAVDEARRPGLGRTPIDSEHLLAGIIREDAGTGAKVLNHLGINLEKVRMQITKIPRNM